MPALDLKKLKAHRTRTYRLTPISRLRTSRAARDFVNERGFVFFLAHQRHGLSQPVDRYCRNLYCFG